jgi:hypothetical protein
MVEVNMDKLSRVDELTARKITLEKALVTAKGELEKKTMLMLASAFMPDAEAYYTGLVVFYERWIADISKEIEQI